MRNELHAAEVKLKELKPNVLAVLNEEIKTMMKLKKLQSEWGIQGTLLQLRKRIKCTIYLAKDGSAVWTDNLRLRIRLSMSKVRMPFINLYLRSKCSKKCCIRCQHQMKKAKELMDPEVIFDGNILSFRRNHHSLDIMNIEAAH